MAKQSPQLTLPYEELPALASRDIVRKNSVAGKSTYHINMALVCVRENFNIRLKPDWMTETEWFTDLHIEELAMDILANGLHEPIKGDMSADGKLFILTDGYRRYLAVKWLLENGYNTQKNGKSMDLIEATCNPSSTTELDRVITMLSSDKKLPYKDIQMAEGIHRLHMVFGLSRKDIKEKMGKSRQWVDNMLALASEPQDIKDAVTKGTLTATAAIRLAVKETDPEKRSEIVQSAQDEGRTLKVDDVTKQKFEDPMHVEQQPKEFIPGGLSSISTPTETKQALDAELDSRKTDGKFKEKRSRKDGDDALGKVDFSQDKVTGELELNEIISMADKVNVRMDTIPMNKQDKEDMQRLLHVIGKKAGIVREILKKAADER